MSVRWRALSREGSLGPGYRRLWSASVISNLGDGVNQAALPLLVVTLTADPRLVSGVAFAAGLPWLAFALVSGALVDRLDRRRLMWAVNSVRAALVGLLALAVATDVTSVALIYAIAFCLGTAETLFDNAAQAFLPTVVSSDLLERANGRQYAGEVVANALVGPPLGAVLFTVAAAAPFWLDSTTFAVSAVLIASIRPAPVPGAAPALAPRRSLRADIAEGLRWLRGHRLLRTLALLLGTANLASNLAFSTFVLFAVDELGVSERGYGLLLAGVAAGGVLGGLTAPRIVGRLGQARSLALALGGMGASLALVGLARDPYSVGVLLAGQGVAIVGWNVITVSLRQAVVPARLLGRVNSVYRTVGWGSIPLGALAGGFLARATNLRVPWLAAGALTLVASGVAAVRITQTAIDAARAEAGEAS